MLNYNKKNNLNKLISIIVPVFNVQQYLQVCIDSILQQTYPEIEIIIVDDGSTDESSQICDNYLEKDNRIIVIHQENKGLSAARNAGIDRASGQFFLFVDSDDCIHKDMVACLYKKLIQYDADISICSYQIIKENETLPLLKSVNSKFVTEILTGKECLARACEHESLQMIVTWNKLYRKELFDRIRFPVGKVHEDEFTTYKILYPLQKCVYYKKPLYFYRQRNGSITKVVKSGSAICKVQALGEQLEFFHQKREVALYNQTLGRYMTVMADAILVLENDLENSDSDFLKKLEKNFKDCYKSEIIKKRLCIRKKIKFTIFFINRKFYGLLIRWYVGLSK